MLHFMKNAISHGANMAKKSPKDLGGLTFGLALNTGFAAMDYNHSRSQGNGVLESSAYAAGSFMMGEVLGLGMFPLMAAQALPGAMVTGVETLGKVQRQMDKSARPLPFNNSHFADTQQAFTMRQAGMKIAQQSQYNLQQSLMGNEASFLR